MPSQRKQFNVRADEETEARVERLLPMVKRALGLEVTISDLFRLGMIELERRYGPPHQLAVAGSPPLAIAGSSPVGYGSALEDELFTAEEMAGEPDAPPKPARRPKAAKRPAAGGKQARKRKGE